MAVFGGLNASGLSASQEISQFGLSGAVTPPDTTGAIGPSNYIEFVNSEIAMYKRTDLSMVGSPVNLDSFTSGTSTCDPQIKFDPQSGRWFYLALRCDGTTTNNQLYVGWSKASNPSSLSTASWCTFAVSSTPSTSVDDYPKLGLDATHMIIGANLFDASSLNFQTAQILVAAKPPAGTISACGAGPTFTVFGSPSSPLTTSAGNFAFTPEPATVADGSSSVGYVVAADFEDSTGGVSGNHLMLWRIDGSADSPTLVADGDVAVSSFSVPPPIPQPAPAPSTDTLDSQDGRLTQAVAAVDPNAGNADAIWTQHTVCSTSACPPGSGSVVRWYEIVPSTLTLVQSGTIVDPAGYAFNGAIAPTLDGGAVIDYDTGGTSQTVDVKAQARNPGDPLGTMTPLSSPLATSTKADSDFSCPSKDPTASSCRWGDYAGASVDPNCPDVVWGSNQVDGTPASAGYPQWQTQNFVVTPSTNPVIGCFSASPNPATAGSSMTFDASDSVDSGGTIATYSWDFGDGSPAGVGKTTTHTYAAAGTYKVTLTASDGTNTAIDAHLVTVVGPPSASFAASPTTAAVAAPVSFDATGSSDPGTTITTYSWSFGDGTTGTGPSPGHSYASAGTYTVRLTVGDGFGETASTTHTITAVGPPSASFTASPNPETVKSPVTFDATGSSDPGAMIANYSWNFGDGSTGTGSTPSHSYAAAGSYTVTLTVGDNFGETASTTRSIAVVGPPSASFTSSPNPATVRSSVSFDAGGSSDPGTRITTYSWSFGDGSTGTGSASSHSYTKPGTYPVTLTVADSYGERGTVTHSVAVKPPRLSGRMAIRRNQRLLAVLTHGLIVVLSTSEPARPTFQVSTLIKASKRAHTKAKSLMLLRGRPQAAVSTTPHQFILKLSASAARAVRGARSLLLNVQVTLADAYGQKLTLSAKVTLRR